MMRVPAPPLLLRISISTVLLFIANRAADAAVWITPEIVR